MHATTTRCAAFLAAVCAAGLLHAGDDDGIAVQVTGDWQVQVTVPAARAGSVSLPHSDPKALSAKLNIASPTVITVQAEKHDALPLFNANAAGWVKGAKLRGLQAQECTAKGLLDPASVVIRSGPQAGDAAFQHSQDYASDIDWGTFGRLPGGKIGEHQPVYVAYRYTPLRIDAIVLTPDGAMQVRQGEPHVVAPTPPAIKEGERRLANVFLPGPIQKLQAEQVFPILETAYPEPPKVSPSPAEQFLPKTLQKLREGLPVRILAWGDSVTAAGYLPDNEHDPWQAQFVARLQQQFPAAKIELVTEAWGGRNTASYLAEPPGSAHNYREKVLAARPDLVVSEFVNDAGLNPKQVKERYAQFLADFSAIGAEWIILTPHYIRPDWMGLTSQRDIDNDPRPYVAGLRQFAAKHSVALADASLRYGRLWRQGIPYSTLMLNGINHPGWQGMKLFADSLMALFP